MGNQPNNILQCGGENKESKQQTLSTRQQIIRQHKGRSIFNSQIIESKIGTVKKVSNQNSNPQNTQYWNSSKNNKNFVPEHQNLLKISKVPKSRYNIVGNGEYFQQEKGKCLDEIIQSRYNTTMHFPQYQIRSLLQCLVYSLAYMSKKCTNYHDFYPTNIFYNNNSFKMLNPLTVKKSGYLQTQQRKRFSFLSPELILEVLNDTPEESIGENIMDKADVFAIGMILLEFCTLLPSSECYDSETYSIVDAVVSQRVEKTRELYNPLIGDCIDLMLQYQVEKRIPPQELAYTIHQNIEQIRDAEANQMSRIQQMSRMTFSQTPNTQNQPRIVMPPGFVGEPKVQGGRVIMQGPVPPYVLQGGMQGGIQGGPQGNALPQPFKVSVPNQGQLPPNFPPQPYGNGYANTNASTLPTIPQNISFQTVKVPPMSSQIYNERTQRIGSEPESTFVTYKKPMQTSSNYSSNLVSGQKISQISTQSSPKSTFLAQESNLSKSPQSSASGLSAKQKLNPFEQIQEQVKEDEDESPSKNVPTFGTGNSNAGYLNYFQTYSSAPKSLSNPTTIASSFGNSYPSQSNNTTSFGNNLASQTSTITAKFQPTTIITKYEPTAGTTVPSYETASTAITAGSSNKFESGYTFKTSTTSPYSTTSYSTYSNTFVNSSFGDSQPKEESLDQRVRKILEASKNIK